MIDKFKRAAREYGMCDCKELTVALSGGADSAALLLCANELKEKFGFRLSAAHLNHCLRGAESDEDEAFCRELCDRLGIELFCERADVSGEAASSGESLELAARRIRYAFLFRVSPNRIATAHTADDNLETVVFNLCRGTGLSGLTGIPPVRERIVRPLIYCTRSDTERFCRERGVEFRVDSTNLSDEYSRNYIRHNIIPHLKKLNPSVASSTVEACRTLAEDRSLIEAEARSVFEAARSSVGKYNSELFATAEPSLAKRAVMLAVSETLDASADRGTLEAIYSSCVKGIGRVNFHGNSFAEVSHGLLTLAASNQPPELSLTLPSEDFSELVLDGYRIFLLNSTEFDEFRKVHKKLLFSAFDYDKITGTVLVRHRKEGDSLRPVGRGCRKTLKKLFSELKLPVWERERMPIITDDAGLLAVGHCAVDQRAAVTRDTKRILVTEAL